VGLALVLLPLQVVLEEPDGPHPQSVDLGSTLHVANQLWQLWNHRRVDGQFARCGSGDVSIEGYGNLTLHLYMGRSKKASMVVFSNVAYIPSFPTTIISLQRLQQEGYRWEHWNGKLWLHEVHIGLTKPCLGQYKLLIHRKAMEYQKIPFLSKPSIFAFRKGTRPSKWGDGMTWHKRMGHIGQSALEVNSWCENSRSVGHRM